MQVEESTLPGVGRKIAFKDLAQGQDLAVVTLQDGGKVLYVDPDGPDPIVIRLGTDEARIIGQAIVSEWLPKTLIDYVSRSFQGGFSMDQITLSADSPMAGLTIVETKLRQESGALILAVVKGGEQVRNPPPTTVIKPGDVLILVGDEPQLVKARRLILGNDEKKN
jgi:TrkA domain protein